MKIDKISVVGLFGTFDHEIVLNSDPPITLVLGRNGLGKTILLRMLSALFTNHLEYLCQVQFKSFTIYFELGNKLVISRQPKTFNELKFEFSRYKGQVMSTDSRALKIGQKKYGRFQELLRNSKQLRESYLGAIMDVPEYDFKDKFELVATLSKNWLDTSEKNKDNYPKWLKDVMDAYNGHLITTERIIMPYKYNDLDEEQNKFKRAINECSKDILKKVGSAMNEAANLSAELDRSFPNRIIQAFEVIKEVKTSLINELVYGLEMLKERQNILQKTGIQQKSDKDFPLDFHSLNLQTYTILSVYVKDSLEKLKPYEDLANKLQLFLEIMNSKLLFKKVQFVQNGGFKVVSTKTNDIIQLQELSSGEQHLFILFYQMLFMLESNSLLLIDEPEISLHVGWQKHFVEDLMNVLKLNPMTVIMATHSPTLIGPYWNLTSELHYEE